MNSDLYKPSLQENELQITRSYNISKLFYAAFFGGIIPTVVLSCINMKWLRFSSKFIMLMASAGALVFLAKVYLVYLFSFGFLDTTTSQIRLISRIGAVVLYMAYYFIMKSRYEQHMFLNGSTEPLLKNAIIWSVVGFVIELILVFAGGVLAGNGI